MANWQIPRNLHDRRKRESSGLFGRGIEEIDIRMTFARRSTSAPFVSMLVTQMWIVDLCPSHSQRLWLTEML